MCSSNKMEISDDIKAVYILKLYITGASPGSKRAVNNTRAFCEKNLKGNYDLPVIDIQATVSSSKLTITRPLFINQILPLLKKQLIGNMYDMDKIKKG